MKVLYLSLVVLIADQVSKFYVKGISLPFLNLKLGGMHLGESISVIGNFFRITFTENPGMAFGFDPGSDFKLLISIFSLVASVGLLIYLFASRNKSLSLRIAIALILAGALGNVFDRMFYGLIYHYAPLFYGKVVDFFDFDFFNFTLFGRSYERWPIFNIADASVTVGVLILLFFYKKHQEDDNKAKEIQGDVNADDEVLPPSNNLTNDVTDKVNDEKLDGETDKGKEISL
ncbi:MAG: signal peptidase II [Ignavibacteriaceae bacterium]|nr:signal peptidase II [Ignavibacteriaceae bacterium]MCW8996750.1 signal peptidase II [Psychromonas sp.]MCW9096199.1 signal peptidase II [Ignavibacteriaceae bacterium]